MWIICVESVFYTSLALRHQQEWMYKKYSTYSKGDEKPFAKESNKYFAHYVTWHGEKYVQANS